MSRILILIGGVIALFSACTIIETDSGLRLLAKLPVIIPESSGLEVSDPNQFWSFNDSGGEPELYQFDSSGALLRKLYIANVPNRDWEDITQDDEGNFYIGDVGNNNNATKVLSIYKIANPNNIIGDTAIAEIISFRFSDQQSYPPPKDNFNFDCEAFFWSNGYIYLFSKNRSFPTATNLYRIPDSTGDYVAKRIGRFLTGKSTGTAGDFGSHWVTAADISPDGRRIVLINETRAWVFTDFTNDDFFAGEVSELDLGKRTQKEAVCFLDDSTLLITDELWINTNEGGNLYRLGL